MQVYRKKQTSSSAFETKQMTMCGKADFSKRKPMRPGGFCKADRKMIVKLERGWGT